MGDERKDRKEKVNYWRWKERYERKRVNYGKKWKEIKSVMEEAGRKKRKE